MPVKLRFRHIEGFRAVMQTGTATGAASLLNVTQPAVSQLMTEMEAAVGFALFDRRGGRLVPTSSAGLLFDEVERCFTGLDHVNAFCARLQNSDAHAIVLAAVPSMALTLLPVAIGRYMTDVTKDFFTLFPRHSNEAIRLVGSQKADIGFGSKPATLPGIHCEPISTHEAVCALPPDHPLAAKASISARDLDGQPFITMSRTEGVHEIVEDIFRREKVEVANVAECSMSTAACALVENGVGLTLVEQGAATLFAGRRVALRRFTPAVPVTFYAYWLDKVTPHFRRNAFVEILKKEALEMEATLDRQLDGPTVDIRRGVGIEQSALSAAGQQVDPAPA
jgi:DNA-binding transcriptional LysR family regulator